MDRVSCEKLREMPPGSTKRFSIPTGPSLESARVLAARMSRHLQCRFSVNFDGVDSALITRHQPTDTPTP